MKIETLSIDQKDEKAVLKTYILDDYPKYYQQQKRPAVVICPGGGYTTLARKEGEPVDSENQWYGLPCICTSIFCHIQRKAEKF